MSLVGSLADLGLGDILQIVSLSRKSGLLSIHSDEGEGRVVFCDGLVRAAYVKGEPEDLRALLVNSNFLAADEFQRADELANARGVAIDEVIPEGGSAEEPRPFIAMEFIEGEQLDVRIKAGLFSLEDAVRIASQIASSIKIALRMLPSSRIAFSRARSAAS